MAVYPTKKWKTPGRGFWRFCVQMASSLGVFFLVLTIFQGTSPGSLQWQQFLRSCFTTDADLAPVMQFLQNFQVDSLPDGEAIRVNAAVSPVQEAMAVPVTGKVVNEYGWNQTQPAAAFQDGLLIATAPQEEIKAAYSGTVTDIIQTDSTYTIELSHANGLVTIYGNCTQCYVQSDEPVEKGQSIGVTGQTDGEEGNFYFAARYLGEPLNPLELMKEKETGA